MPAHKEFHAIDKEIYLNHAAIGPWPQRTQQAIRQFAAEFGSRGVINYSPWPRAEQDLRSNLARLVGADSPGDITLCKNTSEAISTIAFGIKWQNGDEVLVPKDEFPANRFAWKALEKRGVAVRLIAVRAEGNRADALIDSVSPATRLISCSSIQYDSGEVTDLHRIGTFCREHEILFCVDAIQSLGGGQLINVQDMHIDALAGGSHKWLLAPEGVGFAYIRESLRAQLEPLSYGWRMSDAPITTGWLKEQRSDSGSGLECGTLNTLGMVGLNASLSLLFEEGLPEVCKKIGALSESLQDGLESLSLAAQVLPTISNPSGIVNIQFTDMQPESIGKLFRQLRSHHVHCAMRGQGLRFSPHFYNDTAEIECAIERLANIASAL